MPVPVFLIEFHYENRRYPRPDEMSLAERRLVLEAARLSEAMGDPKLGKKLRELLGVRVVSS